VRTDEVVAFDWQDAACDPRLPACEFSATWRGRLSTKGTGSYRLQCFVQGEIALKLAGKTVVSGQANEPQWLVSQPLELDFDYHLLEITYRLTQARGQLALFWSGPDFRLEPVPERALWHEREQSPPAAFERGRQLAAALRCGACHKEAATMITPAPALDRLTGNIGERWVVNWLSNHEHGQRIVGIPNDGKSNLFRMPDFGITQNEAEAIAAWLLRAPLTVVAKKNEQKETKPTKPESKKSDAKSGKKSKGEEKPKPSAEEGERLVLSRGCLACHKYGEFGESGLFGGGDITTLFSKRPPDFLTRWLESPSSINRTHRMPLFTFSRDELESLKLWAERRYAMTSPFGPPLNAAIRTALAPEGEKHVAAFRCANCHVVSEVKSELAAAFRPSLAAESNWTQSCAGKPDRMRGRPGYHLAADDQAALKAYYSQPRPGQEQLSPQARGRELLVHLNCLACHQREGIDRSAFIPLPMGEGGSRRLPGEGLSMAALTFQDKLTSLADAHPDLAPLIPAMTPPALNSVGDKLHDAALAESISRQGPPHRPYLLVQMPKFALTKDQLADLTAYFTATDRIPAREGEAPAEPKPQSRIAALAAAGPRLVTTDGLACTSCHQVGSVLPTKAPLNARGPDISMLEKRIRREWFDRWCDNPARIVPRMEMPAVKIPVRGVLNDKLDDQLAAVWHILNTPGFEPPEPNPVRTLRLSGIPERNERPIVIHDVVKDGDKTYLFPLVIGLPNRHNILFDLETNRLAAWWLGDTARQRTKGKSWYWEMGGKSIFEAGLARPEVSIQLNGKERFPEALTQFTGELQFVLASGERPWNATPADVDFATTLRFPSSEAPISAGGPFVLAENMHMFRAREDEMGRSTGFTYETRLIGKGGDITEARVRLVSEELAKTCNWIETSRTIVFPGKNGISLKVLYPRRAVWNGDGTVSVRDGGVGEEWLFEGIRRYAPTEKHKTTWTVRFLIDYQTTLPQDRYLVDPPPKVPVRPIDVVVAPGFAAKRLPLADDIMPSAFAWNGAIELVFATLNGEVFKATDSNGDELEDSLHPIVDGLATPYGIHVDAKAGAFGKSEEYIDVAAKDGLRRLEVYKDSGASWIETIVSGWGHTDDYHDWAVGLIRDEQGAYYVALPCQQDKRSEVAAKFRGQLVKLVPRKPSLDDPRAFDIEVISSGHRFPMGMARNREGELFVTDNQGNYNPFNELNHVRKGAHFGFINANEKVIGFKPPPLTAPAIDIPHPWTRSVNGICFLETPDGLRRVGSAHQDAADEKKVGTAHHTSIYGPLEGHLVGCEYDTRRLIRMSLQKVNGEYQGCAYPLSIPPADVEQGLLGPIVCAIKPTTGELYVGEIRDSGWGAGNNIGQIVKIKIEPEKLPCGIAEVRATNTGFTIDFFQPVDRAKAANAASYSIESYRRESTPAYGGPDIDRRPEKISAAEVSADGKRVTLTLSELRAGHNYELRLKNLTPGGGMFHPDEAHYTMRQIPK
jgi:mono/diheme cytochrome c family protein